MEAVRFEHVGPPLSSRKRTHDESCEPEIDEIVVNFDRDCPLLPPRKRTNAEPCESEIDKAVVKSDRYAAPLPYRNHTPAENCELESDKTKLIDASLDNGPNLTIHPLGSHEGVLIQVHPPAAPTEFLEGHGHVACDIVLVIDISTSMTDPAPTKLIDAGYTVQDLAKHAARTMVSTLNEGDRLGIVTFCANANVCNEWPVERTSFAC